MKFDTLHFALLAVVVLLAVYGFGSGVFREGLDDYCVMTTWNEDCIKCRGACGGSGAHNLKGVDKDCAETTWNEDCTQCRKACGGTGNQYLG